MKKIAIAAGLALALGVTSVQAQVPGYAANSTNTVWRTTLNDCWKTSSWTQDKVVEGCPAVAWSGLDGDGGDFEALRARIAVQHGGGFLAVLRQCSGILVGDVKPRVRSGE